MGHLIKFEFIKFFGKKKNLVLIAILFIISFAFIGLNIRFNNEISKSEISSVEFNIESVEEALKSTESDLLQFPDDEKLEKIKDSYETELGLWKQYKDALDSDNWINALDVKIKIDKKMFEEIDSGFAISGQSIAELKENIEVNSILLENEIKPINNKSSMIYLNFLKLFLDNPIMLVLAIIIIVFTADIVSSEFENKTCNILLTQPVSKNKILISKIISAILLMLIIMAIILLSASVFLSLTEGIGVLNYPTRVFLNGEITYIGIGRFLLYLIPSFTLLIIFIVVLSVFISTLTKQSAIAFSITIILTTGTYMLINSGLLNNIAHLIPFTYISLSSVLQGNISQSFSNNSINIYYGNIILSICTILLLVINFITFKRKSTLE